VSARRAYSDPEVLARIVPLGLRARYAVRGTLGGLHASPLLGQSVEFAGHREYAPGDDLRRLDWRVWARTGRHYVKEYEEETNLAATFLLDASASMGYGSGPLTKYEYAATAAACLATLCVEQRDAAGLVLFDESPAVVLRASSTRAQLAELCAALERARPARRTDLGAVLEQAAEELPARGLCFVLSDFLCEPEALFRGLARLAQRRHEVVLCQVLDRDELELPFEGAVEFRDLEGDARLWTEPRVFRAAYRAALERFCNDLAGRAKDAGCDHELLRTDRPLAELLASYLHRRQRHLARRARPRGPFRTPPKRARPGGGGA